MSSLRVLVHAGLEAGFALAGVETFPVEQPGQAESLLEHWLDSGETGLIALDERLVSGLHPALLKRLDESEQLFHVSIPSGRVADRPRRITRCSCWLTSRRPVGAAAKTAGGRPAGR